MKNIQKAEIRKAEMLKLRGQPSEASGATSQAKEGRRDGGQIPDWWAVVPDAEKAVIRGLIRSARGLKRSPSWQVAQAARKWERSITCFIKFRLMGQLQHGKTRVKEMA